MSAKRSKVVKGKKGLRLTVYPWTHPATGAVRWRFAWKDGNAWRYSTYKTKAAAEDGAAIRLEEIEEGGLVWSGLTAGRRAFLAGVHAAVTVGDEEIVLAYLSSRGNSGEIGAAVNRFIAGKMSAAGELSPYLGTVKGILDAMAEHFQGRSVADIHQGELQAWWDKRTEGRGWKLRRDVRGYLVMFWRWSLREGIAGREPVTVADRLPMVASEDMERRVLTVAELGALLGAVADGWRAWVVLGAFGGLRPEEIAPGAAKRKGKRGLLREEIDWRFGVIRLPACVSKVNRPRNIPMSDALQAGLEWAGIRDGQQGSVCETNPSVAGELNRLGKEVFVNGWPKDALRHSYGSYRNALVRSLEQVAEEMGTSVAMLHRHYHNPKAEAEGVEWFAVRPATVPICSDGIEVDISESGEVRTIKPLKSKRFA
jgi:integrase